ncbi:MAG TPA: M23 family metallopeptidase [Dyella sp.]|nr:M23 family metallopeptidase [Dyella sp.]
MRRWLPACFLWLTCVAAVPAHPVPTSCTAHRHDVRRGDTAVALARRDGVDAHAFANWLARAGTADRLALRRMRPGDHLELCVAASPGGKALMRLHLQADRAGRRRAGRTPRVASLVGVRASAVTIPLDAHGRPAGPPLRTQASITTPLPAGTPLLGALADVLGHRAVVEALAAYAHHVWHVPTRLPRDGDYRLTVLEDPAHGRRHNRLAMVTLQADGRAWQAWHYVDARGHDFVVGRHGRGFEVLRPRHPVNHARISSGWGWRVQPVLGGREFHRGIDYAAPMGTPVHAAMDGTVSLCDWHGGYGRVVEIRHAHGLRTRYGHLSRFASRLHPGSRVHRGQVIGYVGSTGLSTGPHLYFEIWEHGVRVNPLRHDPLTVAARLDTRQRKRLRQLIESVQQTS